MEESVIPHHSLTYGTSRLAPAISLVDRAKEIELAEESVKLHVHGKLEVIAKQIRALKEEAELILQQAEKDIELHKAKCQFEKRQGKPSIYMQRIVVNIFHSSHQKNGEAIHHIHSKGLIR